MRLIDADALYERICDLEAQALAYVRDETDPDNLRGWSAILAERTAFKHDVFDAPTIEPEPQWIPCSERLPDIKEYHCSEPCIVYCENGAYGFAELEENIFEQVGWNCERDDEYHEPLGKVLAWMPLPEPYKEDTDE